MKYEALVVWLVFAILFFASVEFIDTMRHESAHKVIFEEYGCNATVTFGFFSGVTVPSCPNLSESEGASLSYSQSMVEAFGYQNRLGSEILALILATVLMLLIVVDTRMRQ